MMLLYIISLVVFFGITFYLSYLIGKYSNYRKYQALVNDVQNLKEAYQSSRDKYEEMETQMLSQSQFYAEEIEKIKKLKNAVNTVELKKNNLNTELLNLKERLTRLKEQQQTEHKLLINNYEQLDREALEWKNKYIQLHRKYQHNIKETESAFEKQAAYTQYLIEQKYALVQRWDARTILPEQKPVVNAVPVQPKDNDEELISDLELKVKRQDNIIKALRIQLKQLNLAKIESTNIDSLQEGEALNDDISDSLELHQNLEEIIEENDFHEIIDEENEEAQNLIKKLKAFKEIKVRKTGDTTVNYSKVNQLSQSSSRQLAKDAIDEPKKKKSRKKSNRNVAKSRHSRLSLIFNIDRDTQQKLYDYGILSFDQLAQIKDEFVEELESILGIDKGRIHREKWIEQAQKLSSNDDIRSLFIRTRQNEQSIDQDDEYDLQRIKGIGKTFKTKFIKIGITDIRDLASWQEENIEELAELLSINATRILKQKWIPQAKSLISKISVGNDFSVD